MNAQMEAATAVADPGRRRRLLFATALLLTLAIVAKMTGLTDYMDAETLRVVVVDAGPLGMLLFLAAFAFGSLVKVPSFVFVATSVAIHGQVLGGFIGLVGSLIAVSTTFCAVPAVGGRPVATPAKGFIVRILGGLQRYSFRTVVSLRLTAFLSPPVNYALAFSPIRYRDFMMDAAVGLVPPLLIVVGLADCFLT